MFLGFIFQNIDDPDDVIMDFQGRVPPGIVLRYPYVSLDRLKVKRVKEKGVPAHSAGAPERADNKGGEPPVPPVTPDGDGQVPAHAAGAPEGVDDDGGQPPVPPVAPDRDAQEKERIRVSGTFYISDA